MTSPATRTLGVHGLKQRWIEATVATGLVRDSAAWFMVSPAAPAGELHRTLAAAIYLALSHKTCATLEPFEKRGTYAAFFHTNPDLLPALLVFADAPTGHETLHRYVWLGPPAPGPTAPYTKVARADRAVHLTSDAGVTVLRLDATMVERAEAQAQARLHGRWSGAADSLLRKIPVTYMPRPSPVRPTAGKLAEVCAGLAREVEQTIAESLATLARPQG